MSHVSAEENLEWMRTEDIQKLHVNKNFLKFFFFLQLFQNRKEKMQNLNMTWDFGRTVNEVMVGKEYGLAKGNDLRSGHTNVKLSSFLQKNIGKLPDFKLGILEKINTIRH